VSKEFRSRHERGLGIKRPVDGEHSVEVIDFVLEQFCEVVNCSQAMLLPMTIQVAEIDTPMPFQLHHEVGKAEAVVPEHKPFFALTLNFRIQDLKSLAVDLDVDGSHPLTDLNRGDSSSESMGALELMECGRQIVENDCSLTKIHHRLASLPQQWVAEFYDWPRGHIAIVAAP